MEYYYLLYINDSEMADDRQRFIVTEKNRCDKRIVDVVPVSNQDFAGVGGLHRSCSDRNKVKTKRSLSRILVTNRFWPECRFGLNFLSNLARWVGFSPLSPGSVTDVAVFICTST